MASLYEIDQAVLTVLDNGLVFDNETGEVLFDEDNFNELEVERQAKLEAVSLYIKNLEADAAAIRAEEKALAERRQAKERKAERLREYVTRSMQTFGDVKLETARVALSFRKSIAVKIMHEGRIPTRYIEYKPQVKRAELKKALQAGDEVPGAILVERQNLQIK
jgi:hypothetical protein